MTLILPFISIDFKLTFLKSFACNGITLWGLFWKYFFYDCINTYCTGTMYIMYIMEYRVKFQYGLGVCGCMMKWSRLLGLGSKRKGSFPFPISWCQRDFSLEWVKMPSWNTPRSVSIIKSVPCCEHKDGVVELNIKCFTNNNLRTVGPSIGRRVSRRLKVSKVTCCLKCS